MMKVYARPGGSHYHLTRNCTMLQGKQFRTMRYKEITLKDSRQRGLTPCICAMPPVCKTCVKSCQDGVNADFPDFCIQKVNKG